MNDKELVEALKRGSADPKVQELAAARLNALRWRSVEEGLPVPYKNCELPDYAVFYLNDESVWKDSAGNDVGWGVTRWRYVTAPGEGER